MMRDYTTNNYCDFLWINDILELKKNHRNVFEGVMKKNNKTTKITLTNVTIFGVIVEIKQLGSKGFLYHVDDGTGVIACKHTADQFEEIISLIESEQNDILNQSCQFNNTKEQNMDYSMEDSIFNDNSIQSDELEIHKRNQLLELGSLWRDIYDSFSNLINEYNIGDEVLIMGKLYNYFRVNQIYVNNIRPIKLAEKLVRVSTKLEDGYDPLVDVKKQELDELNTDQEKRFSGLMTFDHIQHFNPKFPRFSVFVSPETKPLKEEIAVATPNLESSITFDTF